jgi:hypothetical protein
VDSGRAKGTEKSSEASRVQYATAILISALVFRDIINNPFEPQSLYLICLDAAEGSNTKHWLQHQHHVLGPDSDGGLNILHIVPLFRNSPALVRVAATGPAYLGASDGLLSRLPSDRNSL